MRLVVADAEIRRTIERLTKTVGRVTTRSLRAELKRSFGHFGNSERVHRLLRTARDEARRRQAPDYELRAALEQALNDAQHWKARAELATHRERVHQDKWAQEVYELRQALRDAREAVAAANARSADYLKLYESRERLAGQVAALQAELATRPQHKSAEGEGV